MLEYSPMTIVVHSKGFVVSQRSQAVGYRATRPQAEQLIQDKLEEYRILELFFCQLPAVRA